MKNVQYKKVLLTHDGSKLASAAIPHAISIATTYRAEVLLLHVVQREVGIVHSPDRYPIELYEETIRDVMERNRKKAKLQLEKIKKMFEANGSSVTVHIKDGIAPQTILETSKKEQVDMIIMSTRGESGLKRAILGSVTDYVIRHAFCPVLAIHPQKVRR